MSVCTRDNTKPGHWPRTCGDEKEVPASLSEQTTSLKLPWGWRKKDASNEKE